MPDRLKESPDGLRTRNCAMRLSVDYADEFNRLHSTNGSLLLSTTSRLGLDTQWHYFEERLGNGRFDALHLGDVNAVVRFAQSQRAEFRTGLGMNWMADSNATDLGFNFTYAADFFPRKPWVISMEFDAGTLGNAHLFHFRTTGGVLWSGVEAYTGYEWIDVGRVETNSLVAGFRFWF